MSKANVVERANALLDKVDDALPWQFNEITLPSDDPVIATWRKVDGYPALMPHPESQSMLTGDRRFIDFIKEAPGIIEELLSLVDGNEGKKSPETS